MRVTWLGRGPAQNDRWRVPSDVVTGVTSIGASDATGEDPGCVRGTGLSLRRGQPGFSSKALR